MFAKSILDPAARRSLVELRSDSTRYVVQIDRRGLAARSDSTWVLSFSVISHASPRGNIVRRFGDARKEVNMPRQEASIRPLNEGAVHCNVLCVCVGRDQS